MRQSELILYCSVVTVAPTGKPFKLKLKSNSKKYTTMIIGEVIGIFIKDKFIKKGRVDSVAMRYVARMGYSEYTTVSSKFKMKRPK